MSKNNEANNTNAKKAKTAAVMLIIVATLAAALLLGLILYPAVSDKLSEKNDTEQSGQSKDDTGTSDTVESASANAAPDFKVYDIDGNEATLSAKIGKPLVINFWATWCPPCVGELPHFDAMYQKYGDKAEFMMVNLTDGHSETKAVVEDFLADNGYSFPVYLDSDANAAARYGISSIPLTVFIDADGNIVNSQVGAMNESTLEAYITKLLEE